LPPTKNFRVILQRDSSKKVVEESCAAGFFFFFFAFLEGADQISSFIPSFLPSCLSFFLSTFLQPVRKRFQMQLEMLHMLVEKGRRMNQDGGGGGGGGWDVCICGGEGRSDRRRKRRRRFATYKPANKQATVLQSLFFFYKRIASGNSLSCPVIENTIARTSPCPTSFLGNPQYP
jgi:hypothetical protein